MAIENDIRVLQQNQRHNNGNHDGSGGGDDDKKIVSDYFIIALNYVFVFVYMVGYIALRYMRMCIISSIKYFRFSKKTHETK